MRIEQVHYLTKKEKMVVSLLNKLGIRIAVAGIVVLLAGIDEAKAHDFERSLDLITSEVSIATRELQDRSWVVSSDRYPGAPSGRKTRFYRLAKPFGKFITNIENEKESEINRHLSLIRKIRDNNPVL